MASFSGSPIRLRIFFGLAILVVGATSAWLTSVTTSSEPGVYTVSLTYTEPAPLEIAAIFAPARGIGDETVLHRRTPDDMTFAKINKMALRPSFAWEVALNSGAWRRTVAA